MWDLLRKDAMQLGIDAVTVDCNSSEFARRDLDRARSHLDQALRVTSEISCVWR